MEWDQNRLARVLALSDEELRPRLLRVLASLGVPEGKQTQIASELPALRAKASAFTEKDFLTLRAALGEAYLDSLVNLLENDRGC